MFPVINPSLQLAENVNYAVKSSFLLSFLESVSGLAEKLKNRAPTNARSRKSSPKSSKPRH